MKNTLNHKTSLLRRRWFRWGGAITLFMAIEAMLIFGHGLVPFSDATYYVNLAFRTHLIRQTETPTIFNETELRPFVLGRQYAGCHIWLPEELWRDCIAIGMNEALVDLNGIRLLQEMLNDPCSTVDWLDAQFNKYKDQPMSAWASHFGHLVALGEGRPDEIRRMRNYFSCGAQRTRTRTVMVFVRPADGSLANYTKLNFLR